MQFHIKWLEYNFIDESFLLNRHELFIDSDDKNTEHYRESAFRQANFGALRSAITHPTLTQS
jgi:hypothetical protein